MLAEFSDFQPAQVEGVLAAFRSVYGDDYADPRVYQPDYWIAQNQSQQLFTYVAQATDRTVSGLVSFYRVAPFEGLYEFGRLAVVPEHRQSGLGQRLLAYALEAFSKEPIASGVCAEMSCHWKVSQNMVHQLNFQDVALAVGLFPAPEHRVSAVMSYFDMRDRAHKVHIPPRWKELLIFCYDELGLQRERIHLGTPLSGSSQLQTSYLEGPRVARLDFLATGQDFATQLSEAERAHDQAQVFQLRLNLEDPRTIAAADIAYQSGYRCCGLLPRWFDGDGLLLQRNLAPAPFEHDHISSRRAQEMARRIEHQWK